MSGSPHSSEKEGTLMESVSQVEEDPAGRHSGEVVRSTDDALHAQDSPLLGTPEDRSTSQSAEEECTSQENQVGGTQEMEDGEAKSTVQTVQEEMGQQNPDSKQEEHQKMECDQEEAIEENGRVESMDKKKDEISQEEEQSKSEGLDVRKEVDMESWDEKSGPVQAEKKHDLGEEGKKEEIRSQEHKADRDFEREDAEHRQEKKVDEVETSDDVAKEQNQQEETRHEDIIQETHQQETAGQHQVENVIGHSETEDSMDEKSCKRGQEEEKDKDEEEDQGLDVTRQTDRTESTLTEAHVQEPKELRDTDNETKEMKRSEKDKEPSAEKDDMGEKNQGWTIIRTTLGDDSADSPMEIDHTVSDSCNSMGKAGSSSEEMEPELEPSDSQAPSKVSPQDQLTTSENQTIQELKDEMMEASIQTPVHSAQPVVEAESMDFDDSGVLSVKVKDEPMDEEYEKALAPHDSTGKVKDEPDTSDECVQKPEDEFKISAVFSVGRNSTSASSGTSTTSAKASANSSASALTPASSLCVVCSGCKKVLLKGQTAFQRKGSPQLYCSPQCLCSTTADLMAKTAPKKNCHYCLKDIPNPKDVIIAPVDSAGAVKDFCSQKCLSTFNFKRDSANSSLTADSNSTKCSICQKACATRHEVNFLGSVHKLCSDACFNQFRSSNKLTMNCCVHCGGYCYSGDGQCPSVVIEGTVKRFCSQNCISTYKKTYGKPVACTMCRGYHSMQEMVENTNTESNRELFCSSACVTAYKVQSVSSSGVAVECNNCKLNQVPQYHLAMSDSTIRNFCSFTCVVSFQDSFNKTNSQNQLNIAPPSLSTTLPQPTPKLASTKPVSVEPSFSGALQIPAVTKIPCAQCQRSFFRKPEFLDFKGKMYAFCDKGCIDEFRRTNYIMAQCVYCKIDKVVKEIKRINHVDCSFCSEGCKLLYKHDLAKRWGKKHCRNCLYCNSTSQTLVTSIFSGKQEEFCGNECLSQYTLLFCQVAKCSTCKRAKKMVESVKWLGEKKHFCSLQCLMYFCSLQGNPTAAVRATIKPAVSQPVVTQPAVAQPAVTQVPISIAPVLQPAVSSTLTTQTSLAKKEATPVIANVISLSNATNGQPNVLGSAALQGAVPACVKLIGHASTQTDTLKQPNAPPPRILKNKALLCKPMSQNKGTSCKPNTCDVNIQTEKASPDVLVLPIPVPVFVPVPMHLYTQLTPHAVGLPLPVPVPMFLPTTLDSAERIVETIQKIKEKIPDNPLEADLIMMAEMVAEDNEKEKTVSHGGDQNQDDNFIEDFDLEALSGQISWEEDSVSSAPRCCQTSESEKAPPPPPPPKTAHRSRSPSPSPSSTSTPTSTPTPQEPQMDLEADFPAESFELLEQQTVKEKTPSTRQRPRRRGRDGFPQKKRARKRTGGSPRSPPSFLNISKLHHEYGVQAWKSWIRWRNTQPNVEVPKIGSRNMMLKEDMLQCSTAELSYGLCKFITEVRRPNGEMYSPDSIHYLCLGIQQHLFENGRMENIFADLFYNKFSQSITNILKDWRPTIMPSGYVHSRVEEEYLWQCKQLGAFSPSVLLNTLLYFCTKFFNFKTVAQHRRLSFAHVMRCTRSHSSGKVACLRFYPPVPKESTSNADGVPAKRKREEDEDEGAVMEMQENADNPLRCPVRLYEFYLSKCSSSVKQRTNIFYLRPERSCVPNSPLWFSSSPLDDEELETMLMRILTVRELYLEREMPASVSDSDNVTDSD
ncbi:zinc finger MYM-type protein 4 isoform X2 [Salminus brasiliensis]|uniref:zinc finger MYM-type protein 4 isoform X2 n=1 Tax=Salminus brasiliensis TaxID=930266 RepID=UPI003B830720